MAWFWKIHQTPCTCTVKYLINLITSKKQDYVGRVHVVLRMHSPSRKEINKKKT